MTNTANNEFPNDNLDETFSNIAYDQMDVQQSVSNKRRVSEPHDEAPLNKRCFTLTQVSEQLIDIDNTKTLSIFDVIDEYQTDPIVKDYADKLIELGFFPSVPTSEEELMRLQSPTVKVDLSVNCQSFVISTMMGFFRTNYFKNNMKSATDADKIVIPIKAKCMMPGFAFVPYNYLERDFNIIHSAGIQMQKNANLKAKYVAELMLINSAYSIFKEVKEQVVSKTCQHVSTQTLLNIYYYKAHKEFMSVFKIKIFDWETFASKVRLILPKWRKEDLPPPALLPNRHAKQIMDRIAFGKESFKPEDVRRDYLDFINKGKTASSSNSSSRAPETESVVPNASVSFIPLPAGPSRFAQPTSHRNAHVAPTSYFQNRNRSHQPPPPRQHGNNNKFVYKKRNHPNSISTAGNQQNRQNPRSFPPNNYSNGRTFFRQPRPSSTNVDLSELIQRTT